jgi:hypothetical protein
MRTPQKLPFRADNSACYCNFASGSFKPLIFSEIHAAGDNEFVAQIEALTAGRDWGDGEFFRLLRQVQPAPVTGLIICQSRLSVFGDWHPSLRLRRFFKYCFSRTA